MVFEPRSLPPAPLRAQEVRSHSRPPHPSHQAPFPRRDASHPASPGVRLREGVPPARHRRRDDMGCRTWNMPITFPGSWVSDSYVRVFTQVKGASGCLTLLHQAIQLLEAGVTQRGAVPTPSSRARVVLRYSCRGESSHRARSPTDSPRRDLTETR